MIRDLYNIPDRMYMVIPGLDRSEAAAMAQEAVDAARRSAPKLSGASARRFVPISGEGYFGIQWMDSYVWFQERGIKAFTMKKLAGKLIPMWVEDRDGSLRKKNPKIKTRVHPGSGKFQVLIFRKAAKQGERKMVKRNGEWKSVPKSYPGAPGRIAKRDERGNIIKTNIGVRWYNPGMDEKNFLYKGLVLAATANGYVPGEVHAAKKVGQ